MNPLLLAKLLLPLAAAALAIVVIAVLAPYVWAIFWCAVVSVPVLTGAMWWWRQRIVKDEATRPFASAPASARSVTRSLERPLVAGTVLARSDGAARGKLL